MIHIVPVDPVEPMAILQCPPAVVTCLSVLDFGKVPISSAEELGHVSH